MRWRVGGLRKGRGLANSCLLALILMGSKRFFRSLLRGPRFMVPDTYKSLEVDSQGSEGAVGFVRRFRGYRDPDLTFHAALSLEQGLGNIVQHGS